MSQGLFLHLTTRQSCVSALAVGIYALSTKGKNLKQIGFIRGSFPDQVEEGAGFVFAGSATHIALMDD